MTAKTVLVLVPHPDDAEFGAGGTIATLARAGARVIIVIATDGGKGSLEYDSATLVALRMQEALDGAAVLGAEPPLMLGYPDLEVDQLPPGVLRERFVRLIRQFRPDVLIAQDVDTPYEKHPDHRLVARAAHEAVSFSHLPTLYPRQIEEGLQPHFVLEKYFYNPGPADQNRIVDISATFSLKLAALSRHRSQMASIIVEMMDQAQRAGLDFEALWPGAREDPMRLVGPWVEARAADLGARIGVKYGEAFRYQRFHPRIEAVLAEKS